MSPAAIDLQRLADEIAADRRALEKWAQVVAGRPAARPGDAEAWYLALSLHHWYNALEHIFERICVTIEGSLPRGDDWHKALLRDMALQLTSVRPAVISAETFRVLLEYLEFRHFVRHAYLALLDWDRLSRLLDAHPVAHAALCSELDAWQGFLARAVQGEA